MTLHDLLIAIVITDTVLALFAGYYWWIARKACRSRDWMHGQLAVSTERFAKQKQSLLEAMDNLKKQLETAETGLGEAQAQIAYDKKEMSLFLRKYKELQTTHQDTIRTYNTLVLQYNSLTSKMPKEGDMPT